MQYTVTKKNIETFDVFGCGNVGFVIVSCCLTIVRVIHASYIKLS